MANAQAMCTSFKVDLLNGKHAFGASVVRGGTTKDSFKLALYVASGGSQGAATTAYSSTGELAASGNYSAGGVAVTNAVDPTSSGTTGFWTPSGSAVWNSFTSSAAFDCALLYNDTSSGKLAVASFVFGSQSITGGTFTLTMPANDASNALIRIV